MMLEHVESTGERKEEFIQSFSQKIHLQDLSVHGRGKSKVNYTLVQALGLCTDRTAHKGSRGIALLFHDHGTRRGEGSASRPGHSLPPGKTRYQLYRRLRPVWTGAENLPPPTRIRSPDLLAHSRSLYRLSYPATLGGEGGV